jgi:hypothetical protein
MRLTSDEHLQEKKLCEKVMPLGAEQLDEQSSPLCSNCSPFT